MPCTADKYTLLSPGLLVNGLAEPVALPLIPGQEQLIALASVCDTAAAGGLCGRNCFQVRADQLSFENPDWGRAEDEWKSDTCLWYGWLQGSIKCELYGMVLYGPGGCLNSCPRAEKADGVFATLTVQLPSHYKGGEMSVRYLGCEWACDNGASDGSNRFNSFYEFCLADVEQETLPIEEGYRLTLIYDAVWIGKGDAPRANAEHMAEVAAALQEHADKSPVGDWYRT